jgi:hypothetical protein
MWHMGPYLFLPRFYESELWVFRHRRLKLLFVTESAGINVVVSGTVFLLFRLLGFFGVFFSLAHGDFRAQSESAGIILMFQGQLFLWLLFLGFSDAVFSLAHGDFRV